MGIDQPSPFPSMGERYCQHQFEKPTETNNNGLDRVTHYLEKIYKTADWPETVDPMPNGLSPFESGKSRADLWQFAALVALESIIERSDFACRHDNWQRQQVPLLEGVNRDLGLEYGIWKCKFKLDDPKTAMFKTGRSDCVPDHEGLAEDSRFDYATMKEENHENPHENTGPLLDNVRKNLGMSARDFIALTSIHGLIHPFQQGSIGSKYNWFGSGPYLSNMYYKYLVNRPTYYWHNGFDMRSSDPTPDHNLYPYAVGDENGKPVSFWGFRISCSDCWNTQSEDGKTLRMGGPCYWRPTKVTSDCPNQNVMRTHCFGGWDYENNTRTIKNSYCCSMRKGKTASYTPEGIQVWSQTQQFLSTVY